MTSLAALCKLHQSILKILGIVLLISAGASIHGFAQVSDPVVLFFKNGEGFRAQGEYKEAIMEYEKALAIDNTRPQIFYWKAICHYQLNEHEKGVEDLEHAIDLNENYNQAYSALLQGYTEVANMNKVVETLSRMAYVEEDIMKRIEYYKRIVSLLVKQREYVKALPHIEDGLQVDPNNYDLLYAKAQSLNGSAQYQSAINLGKPVLSKLPGNDRNNITRFNYEVGFAYYKLTKYKEANNYFERAYYGPYRSLISKLQPNHFYNVAYGFSMIYEYETTERMLETALEIDPGFAKAYDLLADIAIKQEHHHKGILYYEKAVTGLAEQDEYLEEIYNNKLIPTLINAQEFREAVRICDQALDKFPGSRNVRYLKAIALHHQDLNVDAISIMENLLAEQGIPALQKSLYSFAIGIMYDANNQIEEAKESFKSARSGAFTNASLYAYELIIEEEILSRNSTGF
ncbi:MAG: tetratricopeptide repeat protein [Bacteroidota bacterium]